VRDALRAKLPDSEVLTKAEFRTRSLNHWLFATGAGVALIGGAVLGLVVGTVIVAQTLYSSTKDHLNEFATLRALGSSSGYIHRVILAQAGLERRARLRARHGDRAHHRLPQSQHRPAHRHVAGPGVPAARPDVRHVRDLGGVRDRQSHEIDPAMVFNR
jgi:hypothetical protein